MQKRFSRHLDIALFAIVTLIIVLVVAMLATNIVTQYFNYNNGIDAALEGIQSVAHGAILSYSRAWDFAIIKTSSLFVSLLIVLLGSLYILRSTESDVDLSAQTPFFRGAFSTSSPGWQWSLLGVVLAIFSLNYTSEIGYRISIPADADKLAKPSGVEHDRAPDVIKSEASSDQ